jgi:hypothetical protein
MNKTKMGCTSRATIIKFTKAAHILATQFGWDSLNLSRLQARIDVAYAGYLPCGLGLADTFRPRAYSRHGAKYAARLQGGTLDLFLCMRLTLKSSIREDGYPCGRTLLVRSISNHSGFSAQHQMQKRTLWLAHMRTH